MELKTDRYAKTVLTIIAITLVLLLFKPQVQQSLTPTSAHAASKLEGVTGDAGLPLLLTDCYIRNTDNVPVPVKEMQRVEVYWTKPMPVYTVPTPK